MLQNVPLPTKIGVGTAGNGPYKVWLTNPPTSDGDRSSSARPEALLNPKVLQILLVQRLLLSELGPHEVDDRPLADVLRGIGAAQDGARSGGG